MTAKTQLHWLSHTWEYELPNEQYLEIKAELGYEYTPGEKAVMYDRDGSGYPGSPATAELCEIKITEISGEDWTIKCPEWPEILKWWAQYLLKETEKDPSYWETLFFDRYEWPEPDYDDRED